MADTAVMTNEANEVERREVTIKFGKGLVGDPFTSKAGIELSEIKIPNVDPNDHRAWESFVVPTKFIHDNQFGKGSWIKLPVDGLTKLSRSIIAGKDESGKNIWSKQERVITNAELKELVEAYKNKDRAQNSVLSDLAKKQTEAAAAPIKAPPMSQEEELPFR